MHTKFLEKSVISYSTHITVTLYACSFSLRNRRKL